MTSIQSREERYEALAEHVVWELGLTARENLAPRPGGTLLCFTIDIHEIELLDIFRITPGQVDALKLATGIGRCLERVADAIPWGRWWNVVKIEAAHDGAILRVELRGYAIGGVGGDL